MSIPVTRMSELSTGAQLILWAARHLVGAALRDTGTPWCVPRSFEIAGAKGALESLQELVVAVARATPRQIVVSRPSSAVLTPDEMTFVAALTDEEAGLATRRGLREVARHLDRLKSRMASAGLPLGRLGMPAEVFVREGRTPVLYGNPGLADVH